MLACAVCGFGPDPSRWAFLATTGILTFVPLILIFAVALFLYRRLDDGRTPSSPAAEERDPALGREPT